MKLLRLKIENESGFRSLQKGFEINFHSLSDTEAMDQFRPFCFAGLNGSGKSNVLEALANIFYHLEICVARYKPETIEDEKNFNRSECTPDAFTLEYLIGQHSRPVYSLYFFDKVTITKKEGEEPEMTIQPFPFHASEEKRKVSLQPVRDSAAEGKAYLPSHIIGYSSGENEILSLPFIKSRLIHLDEYRQACLENYDQYYEAENSLIYIDSNMSQAVLLACLLFEDKDTLAPLRDPENTGIVGLRSFRMEIHLHNFELDRKEFTQFKNANIETEYAKSTDIQVIHLFEKLHLGKLKQCATSWFQDKRTNTLWLDFYVNDATKAAFKEHFRTSMECFQVLRLLYELNSHFVDEETKADVYRSKGIYTNEKLPVGSARQDVFHFLDFYITKELKKTGEYKDLLLRSFSDGEHQFIHTMGICLLLKDKRSILLLDEPETHFNPNWRAKFIKILNDSITAGNMKGLPNGDFNIHLLKDILLTSHSPFIISDCLPDNVVLFEKDGQGKTTARKASELNIDTYGTSVNILTNKIFGNKNTIGEFALKKLNDIKAKHKNSENKEAFIDEVNAELGDSIEKLLAIKEITE